MVTEAADERKKRYRALRRDTRWVLALIIILLLLLLILLFVLGWFMRPAAVPGARIIPQGTMTAEEARSLVEEDMDSSRITVSLQPRPALDQEEGTLAINFVVVPDNNGFSERFEIEQDGSTVFASPTVPPGRVLEQVQAPRVRPGSATATVYAVDEAGADHGSPVSVEIEVV